jgi:hypothetical protein
MGQVDQWDIGTLKKLFFSLSKRGAGLLEVVIGIALFAILFGGIYYTYYSVFGVIANMELRFSATEILKNEAEIIRNLPYDQVGTQGGIPSGILPRSKIVTSTAGTAFLLQTTVRNIDDPFDGTVNGTPIDTLPADYKLVELRISCITCARFAPLGLTMWVAPKNLESPGNYGSLFINTIDANGQPLSNVAVRVINTTTVPSIDFTDFTNQQGMLQLVGVPPGIQSYQIEVSRPGYSSDKTYQPGDPDNPNPLRPHATVLPQELTQTTFQIDRVSQLMVSTSDTVCTPISNQPFSLTGSKLIGRDPDVIKFSTTSNTGETGQVTFDQIEWDTYRLNYLGLSDLIGTNPLTPLLINPGSMVDFRFVLSPAQPNSLLVTVKDSLTGQPIRNASVSLSKPGFSKTLVTGHSFVSQTDWSNNQYSSQDGIDTDSDPGTIKMLQVEGVYNTSTPAWLISQTLDFGSASSSFYRLIWNPDTQPPQTGNESVKFQVAANNDQLNWNFVGPDGTANSFYTSADSSLGVQFNNNRYIRYKVILSTADENFTPQIDDVSFEFSGPCVPVGQVLFNNLSLGDYLLEVSASGYAVSTTSVTVTGPWQQKEILLSP